MGNRRIVFIDLLRGWAGLVMIEVHVVNSFLLPEIRSAGWFSVLNFINGLVAPSFLFVAGLVFVVVSERKLKEYRQFGRTFWKQLGRIGLIWFLGYVLHIPFFSFTRTLREATPEIWLNFFQADVLHCIAAGLLMLFLARVLVMRDDVYERMVWIASFVVVLGAPFLWDIDFTIWLHPAFGAYVNSQHISQFPLFPWVGFLLLGGVVGMKYLQASTQGREAPLMKSLAWWGIACVAAGLLLGNSVPLPGAANDIRPQPVFFVLRFGVVLLMLAGFWMYEQRFKPRRSFVLSVSRETLLVYAAHLLIIYGTFWNDQSLAGLYGHSMTVIQCALATLGLVLLMVGTATIWGTIKQKSAPLARNLSLAGGMIAFLVFLIN